MMQTMFHVTPDEIQGIANKVAGVMYRRFDRKHELDDLAQEAVLGVIKAQKTYDPSTGVQFRTWAITCAKYHIWEYVRRIAWTSRDDRKKLSLGLTRKVKLYSLYLIPHNKHPLANSIEQVSLREETEKALSKAGNERHQQVLSLHYLNELSLREISDMWGVSIQRVSQIHAKAINNIIKWTVSPP